VNRKYELSECQKIFLDALRGGASLLVVFSHAAGIFVPGSPVVKMHIGDFAVLIFFILSGFLISFSLFEKVRVPGYSFRFYFADRFARIFVPFVPVLFAVAISDYFVIQALRELNISGQVNWIDNIEPRHGWVHFVGNLFMLQDYPIFQVLRVAGFSSDEFFVRPYGSAAPFWTVSIEWWLYVFFGMVAWFLLQPNSWKSLYSRLLGGAALLISSVSVFYHFVAGSAQCLSMVWGLGAIFGWMLSRQVVLRKSNNMLLISVFLFSVICIAVRFVAIKIDHIPTIMELQFSVYLMAAIFSFFLLLNKYSQVSEWVAMPVRWLAKYSYSMYLTHNTVLVLVYVFVFSGKAVGWSGLFLSIVLSNLVAIVFWWGSERHYMKFSSYLKGRRKVANL